MIKSIFQDNKAWAFVPNDEIRVKTIEDIKKNSSTFLSSGVFDQLFFRNIMGMFRVNNLSVEIVPGNQNKICESNAQSELNFVEGETNQQIPAASTTLHGTGLYYIYSKMNHSCNPNTANNSDLESTQVNVWANCDIHEGEEVTTTYLHTGDSSLLSYDERRGRLLQYLFECTCILCNSQRQESADAEEEEGGLYPKRGDY